MSKPILLQKIYQNAPMTSAETEIVINSFKRIEFKKGDYLLKQGQIANEYFCLESGLIRAFVYDYKGDDITINFFGDNDIVVEPSSLFQRIPTKENMQALIDCICWRIDFATFQQHFHNIEGFREWGRGYLSQSLFHFKQRSISMIADSATERYLTLLKQQPQILQNAPLKYIATYLGITDTSLSRIRKEVNKSSS
jgi:CRP-like cAMP-binding protein